MSKKTKTVLILLLSIVVLCTTVLLVACGKLSITGTWYSKSQGHYLVITRKSIIWGSWGNQTVITDDYTYADNIIRYDDKDKYVVSERGNVLYETKNLIAKNSNLPRNWEKTTSNGLVGIQYFNVYNSYGVSVGSNTLYLFGDGTFNWQPFYSYVATEKGVYKLKDGILTMYIDDQPYKFLYIDSASNIYENVYLKDLDKYLPDGATQYKWDILPSPYDPIPDDPVVNNPQDDTPSPQTYTLTYLAGEGGYIQGDTVQSVTMGNDGNAVTAIPSEDSFFDKWDDNGLGIWKIVRYKFVGWSDGVTTATRLDTDITQDITVTAYFEKETETTYTLTYNASEGGRVEGNTTQSVAHGQDGSEVTAIANVGFVFAGWSDGVTTATRRDTNITQDITVTAYFEKETETTYTLTYNASEGGRVEGNTTQSVAHGQDGSIVTAVADEGYVFAGWSDGVTTATRQDTNITQDITVTAYFEKETETTYTLTYNASEGGRVEGNTIQSVAHGQDGSIVTAIADEGYIFAGWSDGVATATRQEKNVTRDHNVTALFEKLPEPTYTLTYLASEGGYIDGNTNQSVKSGNNGSKVTAIPNEGFVFVGWSDGITTDSRQDINVKQNITVTAKFIKIYALIYIAGEGGYIEGNITQSVSIGHNGSEVTAIPNEGYKFVGWSDGVTNATRQDKNIVDNLVVTANFEKISYTLIYTTTVGGHIDGDTEQSVLYGENGTEIVAIAEEGYKFVRWSDGVLSANRIDTNIKENIEITAIFWGSEEFIHCNLSIGDLCDICGLELYIKVDDAVLMYNRNENYLRAEFYGDVADSRFNSVKSTIQEIFIGNNVKVITGRAFSNHEVLTKVEFEEGSHCEEIGFGAFQSCSNLRTISIPDSVYKIGEAVMNATAWLRDQPSSGLIYLGKVAYQYWGTMPFDTTITLREDTVGIADYCFGGQGFLREIKGYENVRHIGNHAFANCISLRNLPISDCLESIEGNTFNGCISIENIVIPKSVTSIDYYAFSGCDNLKEVFYKGTVEDWEQINVSSSSNAPLMNATRYYYSELEPSLNEAQTDYDGNYWHYDSDGNIVIWKKEN